MTDTKRVWLVEEGNAMMRDELGNAMMRDELGNAMMRDELGGKGANLCEMSNIGL